MAGVYKDGISISFSGGLLLFENSGNYGDSLLNYSRPQQPYPIPSNSGDSLLNSDALLRN